MRLSQLRELARRLGIARYSGLLREQLMAAIEMRAPGAAVSPVVSAAVEEPQGPAIPPSFSEPPILESLSTPATPSTPGSTPEVASPTWVALLPRDPQWATVCWSISPADRDRALAAGAQQLALRLTDVTDRPSPHILQEVLVDASASEWHLPVPLGDRQYRVEIGFRTAVGGWISLRSSAPAHIPADTEQVAHSFSGFTLTTADAEPIPPAPVSAPGLHERLYQQASGARRLLGLGSEAFQEEGGLAHGAAGGHLSGVGMWASGREASGAGMAPRQRSFWLVADAELIVYGATDPSATLTVADQIHPLTSDGTFRVHTAFPDGAQNYPIRALAADGEQTRSITLDFVRSTPHARVNSKEEARAEWF